MCHSSDIDYFKTCKFCNGDQTVTTTATQFVLTCGDCGEKEFIGRDITPVQIIHEKAFDTELGAKFWRDNLPHPRHFIIVPDQSGRGVKAVRVGGF